MTYGYECPTCGHEFDVIKPVRDMDVNETCPSCGEYAVRQFVPKRVHLAKTAVTHAEYNPGLGCVVKNARHKEDLCKRKGVVEVGNDFTSGDSMQKHFDQARVERLEAKWKDD